VLAQFRRLPGLSRLVPRPSLRPAPVTGTFGGMTRESTGLVFHASGRELSGGVPRAADQVAEPSPGAETPAEPVGTVEVEAPGHSEYTRQLLAAKRRALEGRTKRGTRTDEKENT
jgi:hypothetical protein